MPPEVKYTPNTSNYVHNSDYGIRVAKGYFDASHCQDSELLFNSNWPIIQIAKVIDIERAHSSLVEQSSGFNPEEHYEVVIDYSSPLYGVTQRLALDSSYIYTRIELQPKGQLDGVDTYEYRTYGFPHGLGFTPMFLLSEEIAGKKGYVFLTGVDITKDVDYPYMDAPSNYLGKTSDYGLRGYGTHGRGGIDISTQSKLVQAVKTLGTSTTSIETSDNGRKKVSKAIVWAPPADSKFSTEIADYTVFGFLAVPASRTFGRIYKRAAYQKSSPNGVRYLYNSVVIATYYSEGTDEATLVVVREPMFSALEEEVVYE